jgi:hypothetical protein
MGLEENAEKTKHMFISREENAGQNHNINRANKPFENVAKLKYFGKTLKNRNCMH